MVLRVGFTLLQCWHRVPGGTARAAIELAAAMQARADVEVIGVGPSGRTLPAEPYRPPVPIRRLPLPYQLLYDVWHHSSLLGPEHATGPVDVVHVTAPTVPARGRAPMVVTLHDVFPLTEPEVLTKRGARLLGRGVELARSRADLVFCSSRHTLEQCVVVGFDPEVLREVPLGVRSHTPSADDIRAVRAVYGLERRFLLWVGTVEPRKNLPTLARAFRRAELADVDLILAGPSGWDEAMGPLLADAGPRARALGFVPAEHLPALMAGAIALIMPSRAEGFGLPALEAMLQGTPVVGSSGTAIDEVVGDTGWLVSSTDHDGWVDAIRNVVGNETERNRLGVRAAARAREYSWERTAELTVQAYRDVCDAAD